MLKGRFSAVILALILHAVLLLLISYTLVIPAPEKIPPKAIKSYLYTPPPVTTLPEPIPSPEPKTEKEQVQKQQQHPTPTETEENPQQVVKSKKEKTPEQAKIEIEKSEVSEPVAKTKSLPLTTPNLVFTPQKQLDELKQRLDQQIIEQQIYQHNRRKSISVLDGTPEAVPHSTKQLTQEEKTEQTTYQMSSDLKTIKGDDGTCLIVQDLSNVGMVGVTAVQSFSCGQSKFDNSFKAHMKKVLKKLGKE